MLIGLCGYYCAGKNYVAFLLEKRGLPVLDLDKVGHQILESEKDNICAQFGETILKKDGTVDRQQLGKFIFAHTEQRIILEQIVHPLVNQRVLQWLNEQKGNCVVNAALIHKAQIFAQLDVLIEVKAPFLLRFFRACKRDRLPLKQTLQRLWSQRTFESYYRSTRAKKYTVFNSYARYNTFSQVNTILYTLGIS
ncbi:MAG: dephospho-CoA kinase [Treponema sp.]|jgi:dephospho-CoA kinase|nr:dephospho-CoA kinase [Treponema sp.]